jgi:hypothetical protein
MGADQSSARDSAGSQEHPPSVAKVCYYEVLGVDRQASDEECVFPFVLPLCSSANPPSQELKRPTEGKR